MVKLRRQMVLELKETIAVAANQQEIEAALTRFAHRHGFEWFTYLTLQEANIKGLSNYAADWQEHYLLDRLFDIDPVVQYARGSTQPFVWGRERGSKGQTRKTASFMRDAASLGIRWGVSIPIDRGFGMKAALTFSASEEQAQSSADTSDQFSWISLAAYLDGFLGRRDMDLLRSADCPLTIKQLECLTWLGQGKSSADIAIIRGVSSRAVEQQLQAAREKLGVKTTLQAALIALDRGWIVV